MDHDPAVLKAIERRKAEEELRQRQRQGSSTSNQQQEDLGIPVQYTIQPVGCATPEDYQNLPPEAASALAGFEAPLQYTLFSVCAVSSAGTFRWWQWLILHVVYRKAVSKRSSPTLRA